MKQITAIFYVEKRSFNDTWMEKVQIRTGKTTIQEAYEVAVANGHNPQKNIKFHTTPNFKENRDIFLTTQNFFGQNGRHIPGKWVWGTVVWCGAVPCSESPDFDTDTEAIEWAANKGWIELI